MSVPYKPDHYRSINAYLIVDNAIGAISFYSQVFGGKERMRLDGPGGTIMHAELEIDDSVLMLSDEFPQMNALSPKSVGGTPVAIMLYTENVDTVVEKAVAAGATVERPVQDQFYGDRSGTLFDPFGHRWTIATHIEDVTPEEIENRIAAMRQEE